VTAPPDWHPRAPSGAPVWPTTTPCSDRHLIWRSAASLPSRQSETRSIADLPRALDGTHGGSADPGRRSELRGCSPASAGPGLCLRSGPTAHAGLPLSRTRMRRIHDSRNLDGPRPDRQRRPVLPVGAPSTSHRAPTRTPRQGSTPPVCAARGRRVLTPRPSSTAHKARLVTRCSCSQTAPETPLAPSVACPV